MIDDSEFESFVFCLAHKRVSSSLLKDYQDLVCRGFTFYKYRPFDIFADNILNSVVEHLAFYCMHCA